jgi:diacylglycerol kinase family enzyme
MSVALLGSNDLAAVPGCHTASDLQHLDITAARPMWLQADGEVLGQVTRVTYQHRPAALRVVFGAC